MVSMSSELWYDSDEDVLGIELGRGRKYWKSVEVAANVVVDLAETGEITGIEILKVSASFKRDIPAVISNARKRK